MIDMYHCGIADTRLNSKYTTNATPVRSTKVYEIEYYLWGNGASHLDHLVIPHRVGTVLFVRPDVARYSDNHFFCYFVHFTPELWMAHTFANIPTITYMPDNEKLKNLFVDIIQLDSQKNIISSSMMMQSKLYELISLLLSYHGDSAASLPARSQNNSLILSAARYIEENFASPIKLKNIANQVGLDPNYFQRIFSRYFGMSPREYLFKKRIEHAKMLLISTECSISAVAEQCGFSSQSYFSYVFNQDSGISPTNYRQNIYTDNL